eukprot:TRINITY_DN6252_c0_g2_i1.p1 TRINITY_DN6252_c0_g2~~TRINITY_DN6252_c0_g2_i1.p1  ORF type:complete len:322 (+),score=67.70 TRINITY_DN6252_c0_g2_i1:537-1502(+)
MLDLTFFEILGLLFVLQLILRMAWGLWRHPVAVKRVEGFYEKYNDQMTQVDTHKGRLMMLDHKGDGEQGVGLLFVHGSCARMGQFEGQIEYFVNKGYHVVAYDAIGCGRSDKPVCMDGSTYHPKRFVDDARLVLNTAFGENEKVVVIGHSFGCYVAMQTASSDPERVIGTVYIGGSAVWLDNVKSATKIFRLPNAILWYIRPLLGLGFASMALAPGSCKNLRKQEAEASSRNPVHMFSAFWRNIHHVTHPDHHPVIPEHASLLISGRHDKITPVTKAEQLAELLHDDSEHVVIEDASHQSMQEQPEAVCSHIEDYINRILQ